MNDFIYRKTGCPTWWLLVAFIAPIQVWFFIIALGIVISEL